MVLPSALASENQKDADPQPGKGGGDKGLLSSWVWLCLMEWIINCYTKSPQRLEEIMYLLEQKQNKMKKGLWTSKLVLAGSRLRKFPSCKHGLRFMGNEVHLRGWNHEPQSTSTRQQTRALIMALGVCAPAVLCRPLHACGPCACL